MIMVNELFFNIVEFAHAFIIIIKAKAVNTETSLVRILQI